MSIASRILEKCEKVNEKKKSKFQRLKENAVPLTSDERKQCIDAKAVWHFRKNGGPSPAVWKSVDPNTKKVMYITNTHRACQGRPTLKGAISIFHKFIKGTA